MSALGDKEFSITKFRLENGKENSTVSLLNYLYLNS